MTTPTLTPALTPAVQTWSDAQVTQANVSTPEYPGPITTDHASGPAYERPGGPQGPPSGSSATVSWFAHMPGFGDIPGDPAQEAAIAESAAYGHAAPQATFDSNAGGPHMSSGPIAMEIHGFDTGGTDRKFDVSQPNPGPGWWRRTLSGQTYNKQAQVTDTAGWNQSTPNDRTDHDQYQGHDANASQPRWIPYSERPVKLNIAHEAVPFGEDSHGAYAPSGQLGQVGPLFWTDESVVYQSPPDPATSPPPASSTTAAAVGFWGS
jgi:hypothetical protein